MSLDLVKNALYQAITATVPGLTFYPEVLDFSSEKLPALCFQQIDSVRLGVREFEESAMIPSGLALPAAPFTRYPVIEAYRTKLALQLRDSVGQGQRDAAAFQRVRDMFNKVDRFFARNVAITVGAGGYLLADLDYQGSRQGYDPASGIFLASLELDVEWRLLDDTGLPTFIGATVAVAIENQTTGIIRITEILTP
jgi:hypothetical protein